FNSYSESSNRPSTHSRTSNLEWFVQDNWKVTRRLTLDYGMRFYWIPPISDRDKNVSGFVLSSFDPARQVQLIRPAVVNGVRSGVDPVRGTVYPASLIGAIAPGTGDPSNGMVVPKGNSGYPSTLIEDRGVHFAPRFGFSYDPFGKGQTAIRSGF